VDPLFFPGGDIGKLAATGTINDLAMCGARPLYMSCSLIIEEGFDIECLSKILKSLGTTARECGVEIVTGDTKVIEKSSKGNLFINTTGIGHILTAPAPSPQKIEQGDVILLSGDIGRHGMAIMGIREKLTFSPPLESDCEDLSKYIAALITEKIQIHALRDVTRGGLASILLEMSRCSQKSFHIKEECIPISDGVNGACEILGLDPLYVACEGRFIAFLPKKDAERAKALLKAMAPHLSPCLIGEVKGFAEKGSCVMENPYGTQRYLTKLVSEQLPRIC
jgi:hydrogenase expression/formation protein HypE